MLEVPKEIEGLCIVMDTSVYKHASRFLYLITLTYLVTLIIPALKDNCSTKYLLSAKDGLHGKERKENFKRSKKLYLLN